MRYGLAISAWNARTNSAATATVSAQSSAVRTGAASRAVSREPSIVRAYSTLPNPLRLAVIARAHFGDVSCRRRRWMQPAGLALGAPLGRLVGYATTYEPSGDPVPAAA